MKIDLDKLTFAELQQLQTDIETHITTRKDMRCYKVTFYVGFITKEHTNDELCGPNTFSDYFGVHLYDHIADGFGLGEHEGVSSCNVVELKPEEFPDMFKL
jgi:hypothetical protein